MSEIDRDGMLSRQDILRSVRALMRPELGTQIRAYAEIKFPGTEEVGRHGSVWYKQGEYVGEVEGGRWLLVTPSDGGEDRTEIVQWLVRADKDGCPMLEPLV